MKWAFGTSASTRVVPRRRRRPSGPDDLRSAAEVSTPYQPLPAHVDLPELDRQMIDVWQASKVFERSLQATADGPEWTFYEGPPTANGMPGTHHIEARVFKDVFPRF